MSIFSWIGSPFLCRVNDGGSDVGGSGMSYGSGNSKVTLDLEHLGLIPVAVPSHFTIRVAGGDDAELAVSVQGKYMYKIFVNFEFIINRFAKSIISFRYKETFNWNNMEVFSVIMAYFLI